MKTLVGQLNSGSFFARRPDEPWPYKADYYIVLQSHSMSMQAPRIRSIEWSPDRSRWELICEDLVVTQLMIFTGARLINDHGIIVAKNNFVAPICLYMGDTFRVTYSLEYDKYERFEEVVESYIRVRREATEGRYTLEKDWKGYK